MEKTSRRERKKQETKRLILWNAKRIIEKKGYENASIREIAEAVDISIATVFNYFPNKESIIVGIADEELVDINNLLNDMDGEPSEVKKIITIIEKLFFDSIKYPQLNSKILYSSFPKNGEEPSLIYKNCYEIFTSLVKNAQKKQEISDKYSTEEIVQAIMICGYGLVFYQFSRGTTNDAKQVLDSTLKIFFAKF